jgi:hypothetical protein
MYKRRKNTYTGLELPKTILDTLIRDFNYSRILGNDKNKPRFMALLYLYNTFTIFEKVSLLLVLCSFRYIK